jgi:hypothetical protein
LSQATLLAEFSHAVGVLVQLMQSAYTFLGSAGVQVSF